MSQARVYADVNSNMPRSYWDYDAVNISWGVLENYEVVRKIGTESPRVQRDAKFLVVGTIRTDLAVYFHPGEEADGIWLV